MTERTIRYFWVRHIRDPELSVVKITYDKDDVAQDMEFFGTLVIADAVHDDEGMLHGFQWEGTMIVPHFNILREIEAPEGLE